MLALRAALREWRRYPWQIVLNLVGVAIGVAVVVAVDLANVSAEREFTRANSAIDGVATHRLVSSGYFDENLYTRIKVGLNIRDAAPVVRAQVGIQGTEGKFRLLGIDPISDYRVRGFSLDGVNTGAAAFPLLVSESLLRELRSEAGETIWLKYGESVRKFVLAGVLESGFDGISLPRDVMVTDIAAAQVFLKRVGELDYIDLRLAEDFQVEQLDAALPVSVRLLSTEVQNHARLEMARAFRINLTALSLLALVIGLFLIYNTVSFQVVRRRRLFGLLRALGITPNELFAYLLVEAGVIAVAGAVAGLFLGVLLSNILYTLVTGTIDTLYFDLAAGSVFLHPFTLLKAASLGIGATLLAAAIPAWEARRTVPRGLLSRSAQEPSRAGYRCWVLAAIAMMLIAWAVMVWFSSSLVASFAALFLLILSSAVFAPGIVALASRIFARALGRIATPGVLMAVRNVRAHLSRTGIATAALSIAVAASLGVGLMIDSFRYSVGGWLESYLRADIYISAPESDGPALSDFLIESLHSMNGVKAVSLGYRFELEDKRGPIELFVLNTNPHGFAGFQLKHGKREGLWSRFHEHGEILVSEPFANRFNIAPGDLFSLPTDRGNQDFRVAAVYYDYSSSQGLIAMDPATFSRFFEPRGYRAAALYLEQGDETNIERILRQFESRFNVSGALYARSNRELREVSIQIFDQTFRVTGILRALAMIVAVTGIIAALWALQMERSREYASLRVTGFTRLQLALQVFVETGFTGFIAGMIAIPIGIMLCLLLVQVINLRSFGWSMQTLIDPWLVLQAVVLSTVSALVAGVYPAFRFLGFNISKNLRDE